MNHLELVSNYNILDIWYSLTKLLSVEIQIELDKDCESYVIWLVDQVEIYQLWTKFSFYFG